MDDQYRDFDHGITAIDSHFVRPGLAAIHLIREGNQAAIIDTGTNHSVPHVLAVLHNKGLTPRDIAFVIVTHVHLDHAGAAGLMMQQFPNARLVVHPRGARHMIDPTCTPVQFEPAAAHASIDRIMAMQPDQIYLTHYSRVTQLKRLAGDLHRMLDEYVALGERLCKPCKKLSRAPQGWRRRNHASGLAKPRLQFASARN